MIIHTSLTAAQMATTVPPGVYFDTLFETGSRTHPRKFTVKLSGSGYRTNPGHGHGTSIIGATWDEWGLMLANVYALDPDARCGAPPYTSAEHFHTVTSDRFRSGTLPADTHRRHRWTITEPRVQRCTTCTAVHRFDLLTA